MAISKLSREIINDIHATIAELSNIHFLRDVKGISQHSLSGNVLDLTFQGKDENSNVMFDTRASCSHLMDTLLQHKQYTVLLYDKSIIHAEFRIGTDSIIKERLIFLKKHNKIWGTDEIKELDEEEEDWFAEDFGIPILIRIDYDPNEHINRDHPSSHFTLSNHDSCRIPMKEAVTFSEFVRFILLHFYNVNFDKPEFRLGISEDITADEKKMMHIYWQ